MGGNLVQPIAFHVSRASLTHGQLDRNEENNVSWTLELFSVCVGAESSVRCLALPTSNFLESVSYISKLYRYLAMAMSAKKY